MAVIREWRGVAASRGVPAESGTLTWNPAEASGHTLLRTIASIELVEVANFPHFPPEQANAVAVGIYQATNSGSPSVVPSVEDPDADWLWYSLVHFAPDFGVTNAVQSDLVWTGQVEVDSRGERKATVDSPTLGLSWGSVGSFVGNGCRFRSVGVNASIRQLWMHTV